LEDVLVMVALEDHIQELLGLVPHHHTRIVQLCN
jgi:hypothetical protein